MSVVFRGPPPDLPAKQPDFRELPDEDELWDDLESIESLASPVTRKRPAARRQDSLDQALAQLDLLWAEMDAGPAPKAPLANRPTPADRTLRLRSRARPGPSERVQFSRRTDEIALWLGAWSPAERQNFLRRLVEHALDLQQKRSLYTVTMPHLHRDTMYAARHAFPNVPFQPLSDCHTRAAKRRLSSKELSAFHRIPSAYLYSERQLDAFVSPSVGSGTEMAGECALGG